VLTLGEAQPRVSAGQFADRDLGFQLAEVRAQAIVQALAEREVRVGVGAVHVEAVRQREDRVVPAGGGEPEEEPGPFRQIDAAERDLTGRDPPPYRHRRVESERLVDRVRYEPGLRDNLPPAARLLEQPPDSVADEARRRLVAREGQREQDGGDLVKRKPPGILAMDGEQFAGSGKASAATTSNSVAPDTASSSLAVVAWMAGTMAWTRFMLNARAAGLRSLT
jgi:hypothetical protein